MKEGKPSASNGTFKIGGMTINLKNIWGKPMGFVLLAFLIGATISQGSFAFADDSSTNPFRAIWDAIGELQTKTDTLQAQIDDLKAQQGTTVAASPLATKTSDGSVHVEVTGGESGQTIVTIFARNSGPDSAVGAKVAVFYETSLLRVNFIEGADCSDGSRGIIECYLGTIEDGSDAVITIDADPIILEQSSRIIAEFSSITRDANPADNHAELLFVTGIAPVAQPQTSGSGSSSAEETSAEQVPEDIEQAEETSEAGEEQTSEETEQTEEQPTEETSETGEEQTSEEQAEQPTEETSEAGEEQPQESEQASEEGTGESTEQGGEESDSEQSEGAESTGDQSESTGESSAEEGSSGEESTGEAGSEESSGGGESSDGGGEAGAGDSGSESGSDSGDAGSSDGSGDSGSASDGGSTGDGGSSNGGSDGGDAGGDSGSDGGDSGGSDGGDSSSTG